MPDPRACANEEARLRVLAEHDVLAAPPDPTLTHIVEFAACLLNAPTAFVSFIDRDRQVFHAKFGLELCETGRDVAFCARTIAQAEPLIVLDARKDIRFRDNPLVTGHPFIRFYAGAPLRTDDGHALGTLCLLAYEPRKAFTLAEQGILIDLARLVLDRLQLRRVEAARQASQARFERIADTSPDAIICADAAGRISFWNSAAERLFGYTASQALGSPLSLIVSGHTRGGYEGDFQRFPSGAVERLINRTIELAARHRNDGEFPVELSLSMWEESGRATYGVIVRDVSQRHAIEQRLFRLAHLDPLTDLPNRAVLRGRIEATIGDEQAATMMIVDLDGFKEVNDAHGHAIGDAVLKLAAARLRQCIDGNGMVARLGGDEFAILLPGIGDPIPAVGTAEVVLQALREPYRLDDLVLHLGASIGVALSPAHGTGEAELMSCADAALYHAKAAGRGRASLFTSSLREAAQRVRTCREGLRLAVERGEFVLHYQPQVRLVDGALVGAEALIRWQHPELGLLMPAAFLEVLNEGPEAARVGDWVMHTACAQARAWQEAGASDFRIGVNLCAAQFRRGDLAERVGVALVETGLPPHTLELEITETIILRHDTEVVAALTALRSLGVGIAFDDYGTGYASLSLLKRFPLTRLKIDRSFVRELCENPQDAAIVQAVIGLSRSFGLAVIAEGVETEEQRRRLVVKGCTEAQGYLFGKPMPAAEFANAFGLGRSCLDASQAAW